MTEDEIVVGLKNDATKEAAFNALVSLFKERIYWHIRKMVYSHDDADDLLQDTFIKVWKHADSFKGESKLYTWIYRIATNEVLTFLSSKRISNRNMVVDLEDIMFQNLVSDDYFTKDEVSIKLEQAILTLPDKQRQIFNMKYFDDLKYSEISEILQTSEGALKASFHHAVKKIEKFIINED